MAEGKGRSKQEAEQEAAEKGVEAKDEQGNRYQLGSYSLAEKLTENETHSIYLIFFFPFKLRHSLSLSNLVSIFATSPCISPITFFF